MNVGVALMNSTTIKVTWGAVDRETVRGHLLGYKVQLLERLFCLACSGITTSSLSLTEALQFQSCAECGLFKITQENQF